MQSRLRLRVSQNVMCAAKPTGFEAFRSASLDCKKDVKRKLRELLSNRPIKHPLSTNERAGDVVMAYTVANKRFGRPFAK